MDSKASEERVLAWKSPYVSPFSRGVIFTRACVSLALRTIPEEKWGLLVVYS